MPFRSQMLLFIIAVIGYLLSLAASSCEAFLPPPISRRTWTVPDDAIILAQYARPRPAAAARLHAAAADNNTPRNNNRGGGNDGSDVSITQLQREALRRLSRIESLMHLDGSADGSRLVPIDLVGRAQLPTTANTGIIGNTDDDATTIDCAVLSSRGESLTQSVPQPCLLLPLQPSNRLGLLERLWSLKTKESSSSLRSRMTRRELYGWNTLLVVNRDGGLFDNLPYAAWSRDRDAAGNTVAAKWHTGKRECYNRLMGKDWYKNDERSRRRRRRQVAVESNKESSIESKDDDGGNDDSFSPTLIVDFWKQQLESIMERRRAKSKEGPGQTGETTNKNGTDTSTTSTIIEYDDFANVLLGSDAERQSPNDEPNQRGRDVTAGDDDDEEDRTMRLLIRRILELQLRDLEMDVAECDSQIAIADTTSNNNNNNNATTASRTTDTTSSTLLDKNDWQTKRLATLRQLEETKQRLQQLRRRESSTSDGTLLLADLIPGIATPTSDYDSDATDSSLWSSMSSTKEFSPFDSPYAMLQEIMAEQMNAQVVGAVLENTSLLDTASVTVGGLVVLQRLPTTVRLAGETVRVPEDDENSEIILVECDADEAIGVALSSDSIPLWDESTVLETDRVMAQLQPSSSPLQEDKTSMLGTWKTVDPELSVLSEGQAGNQSVTERVLPVRLPRGQPTLYDRLVSSRNQQQQQQSDNAAVSSPLFPTDNPVTSLKQYDEMSIDDKARTLMGMSNFDGRLPRPRLLRSSSSKPSQPLDDLLLPLIDESVRSQYRIRDAEERGDTQLAQELRARQSRRAQAQERAARAGSDEEAAQWESEAEFWQSLRADASQDEGSYSRWLDRDEWYERTRQQQAKRVDKTKFGNLLDGLE